MDTCAPPLLPTLETKIVGLILPLLPADTLTWCMQYRAQLDSSRQRALDATCEACLEADQWETEAVGCLLPGLDRPTLDYLVASGASQNEFSRRVARDGVKKWSDDASDVLLDAQKIVDAGKHRGLAFHRVLREKPSYCDWLTSTRDHLPESLLDLRTYIEKYRRLSS